MMRKKILAVRGILGKARQTNRRHVGEVVKKQSCNGIFFGIA